MAKAAEHEVSGARLSASEQNRQHVNRLEQFRQFGRIPRREEMQGCGLNRGAEERIKEKEGDAALILRGQRSNTTNRAYGSLQSWAGC